MNLQELIDDSAKQLLSHPKVDGKVRNFGIEVDHEISEIDILSLDLPDGVEIYKTDGIHNFKISDRDRWIIYLLSKEDLVDYGVN